MMEIQCADGQGAKQRDVGDANLAEYVTDDAGAIKREVTKPVVGGNFSSATLNIPIQIHNKNRRRLWRSEQILSQLYQK